MTIKYVLIAIMLIASSWVNASPEMFEDLDLVKQPTRGEVWEAFDPISEPVFGQPELAQHIISFVDDRCSESAIPLVCVSFYQDYKDLVSRKIKIFSKFDTLTKEDQEFVREIFGHRRPGIKELGNKLTCKKHMHFHALK